MATERSQNRTIRRLQEALRAANAHIEEMRGQVQSHLDKQPPEPPKPEAK